VRTARSTSLRAPDMSSNARCLPRQHPSNWPARRPHPDAAGEDDQAAVVQPLGRQVAAVGPVHAHDRFPRRLQLLDQVLHAAGGSRRCAQAPADPDSSGARRMEHTRHLCTPALPLHATPNVCGRVPKISSLSSCTHLCTSLSWMRQRQPAEWQAHEGDSSNTSSPAWTAALPVAGHAGCQAVMRQSR